MPLRTYDVFELLRIVSQSVRRTVSDGLHHLRVW